MLPVSCGEGRARNVSEASPEQLGWYRGFSISLRDGSFRKGVTLADALNCLPVPERATESPFRMSMQNVYKVGGVGTVGVGVVLAGAVKDGEAARAPSMHPL